MADKYRIMIVDDSPNDIRVVMTMLSDEFAVLAATSGEKALQIAERTPQPDAILMDVEMPGMNGYQTCEALKNNPETANIPVVMLSSHSVEEVGKTGDAVGASGYLSKPVQSADLIGVLHGLLSG